MANGDDNITGTGRLWFQRSTLSGITGEKSKNNNSEYGYIPRILQVAVRRPEMRPMSVDRLPDSASTHTANNAATSKTKGINYIYFSNR